MPQITLGKLLHDLIIPLLLYGLFAWFMLRRAVQAYRTLHKIRHEGITVPASVIEYSEQTVNLGRFRQKQYYVKVVCAVPKTGKEQSFVLNTCSSRGKRYAEEKQTTVTFLSADEPVPLLPEALHTYKRQRLTTLFGGIFCLLFCLLLLFALADFIAGGALSGFLHDTFFAE